ncbi:MAG: DUF881 domain-containing protein [Actinobacteria bacterium]|nr:MAG: DUF881 domain-containing protein [Actinomycetota bacterium]
MHPSPVRPALAAVFVVLGFMFATAFNTSNRALDARASRSSDLAGVVRDMEREREDLKSRLASLRASVSDARRKAAQEAGVRETFGRDLDEARAAAGLTLVIGPGVRVVLDDAGTVPEGAEPGDCVVHDSDIAAVVNALAAAGAEAVSVNGERVTATTPIRCAGTTIMVNSTRIGAPYEVLAIGEPDALEAALREDRVSGPLFGDFRAVYGLRTTIAHGGSIEVPAYAGSVAPAYARAAGGGS